jgi:hypothetical protein
MSKITVVTIVAVYSIVAALVGVNGLAAMMWLMANNPVETVVGIGLIAIAPWLRRKSLGV